MLKKRLNANNLDINVSDETTDLDLKVVWSLIKNMSAIADLKKRIELLEAN